MRIIATNILILLTTFSCVSQAPRFNNDIRRVWSVTFNECRCQWYNPNEIKNITKFIPCDQFFEENFEDVLILDNAAYCDGLIGFSEKSWARNITPKGREILQFAKDSCK